MSDSLDSLDLLHDHYKDSFENIKYNEKQRNTFFIIIAILTSLLFYIWSSPYEAQETINNVIYSRIIQNVTFNFNTIQSLIWLILLYYTIRYFQTTVLISKQYIYLHQIEKTISKQLEFDFCREGKHYNENYSLISNTAYYFYTLIFPLLFIVVLTLNILQDIKTESKNLVFNLIIYSSISLFVIFYLISEHVKSNNLFRRIFKIFKRRG